jgi:hypothetical protein
MTIVTNKQEDRPQNYAVGTIKFQKCYPIYIMQHISQAAPLAMSPQRNGIDEDLRFLGQCQGITLVELMRDNLFTKKGVIVRPLLWLHTKKKCKKSPL